MNCCVQEGPIVLNRKKKQGPRSCRDFNCDFEFVETDRPSRDEAWAMADVMSQLKKKVAGLAENRNVLHSFALMSALFLQRSLTTLDQKIETIRKKRKAEVSPVQKLLGSLTEEALEFMQMYYSQNKNNFESSDKHSP